MVDLTRSSTFGSGSPDKRNRGRINSNLSSRDQTTVLDFIEEQSQLDQIQQQVVDSQTILDNKIVQMRVTEKQSLLHPAGSGAGATMGSFIAATSD